MNKGAGNMDAVVILAVLVGLVFISSRSEPNDTPDNSRKLTDLTSYSREDNNSWVKQAPSPGSVYNRSVSIGRGNARTAYQPYEEYITIRNQGKASLDITGWQLRNAQDRRGFDTSGKIRFFPAESAFIPQAALLLSPYGANAFQNVVLQPGDTAIITTGNPGPHSPYKITSFKENICTGYLENLPEYHFAPSLDRQCPNPQNELGLERLDVECRKVIERMSSCHIPEFDTRDNEGEICRNCIDEKPASSSCVAFAKSHFNYAGCVAYHASDPDFYGDTWRIFLGRGWEMWARDYESIRLFDQLGQLVEEESI